MLKVGQLVWVSARGNKGAGRVTKVGMDGAWYSIRFLQPGREDAKVVPFNKVEPLNLPN